ncbi:mechanosensitive ion channel family protein [Halobaculum sp. MBLA0147]|uniref:mechanosensitive ion channel family protein n=1 Tax=Halobaculum sp. MBLA0147 TaxID=3079934 RepID=UPI003524FF7C
MTRRGRAAVVAAVAVYVGSRAIARFGLAEAVLGTAVDPAVATALSLVALVLGAYGSYAVILERLLRTTDRRRRDEVRSLVRLAVVGVAAVAAFGVVTREWVSVLVSLGVLGFAATFALQQPLASLAGWLYVVVTRPYRVGDRIAIEDTRGDVVSIDLFVTEVWEIDGDLVEANQPSGRIVTIPNSTVLTARVVNFYGDGVQYVWNELSVQVAYETELAFAREQLVAAAEAELGEEMAQNVREYRDRLAETPVELDVTETPTVNVVQRESWVELRLRYLVHPRRGTRVRNRLYERILERFGEHPERIRFPVSRNR